jgi:DnaJ-domain-containing protein 1
MAQAYTVYSKQTPDETRRDIREQFERWEKHLGGKPIQWREIREKSDAAAIAYTLPGQAEVTLRHDRQYSYRSNLRVLFLAIEALRLNDVRGIADVVREAYLALPAPVRARDPFEVLGVRPDAPRAVIEAAYKELAKAAHPDHGGSTEAMSELNAARVAVLG